MPTRRGKTIALVVGAVALAFVAVAVWLGWPHLRFRWRFEPLGPNACGLPEYRHRQTGIIFVRLPGGTFWMGAQKTDPKGQNYDPDAASDDGPVHEVELSPFVIGKYEVSQAEWVRVMGSNPSHHEGEDSPVDSVSWDDCKEFCRKTGLRLPTEAQWEFACRAGTTTPFAFGTRITPEEANYGGGDTLPTKIVAVTSLKPNGFGLHNMHGNVDEWCEDSYAPQFYASPEASQKDPLRNSAASDRLLRTLRGGSLFFDARYCTSASRKCGREESDGFSGGLRLAFYPLP